MSVDATHIYNECAKLHFPFFLLFLPYLPFPSVSAEGGRDGREGSRWGKGGFSLMGEGGICSST